MANILVTETRNIRTGLKKKTLSEHIKIGSVTITITLIVFISIVSIIYLLYANKNATKGYVFKTLEQERTNLILEGEKWDMLIAKSKSLNSIKQSPLVSHMISIKEQPLFIRGDTAVATTKK